MYIDEVDKLTKKVIGQLALILILLQHVMKLIPCLLLLAG